MEYFSVCLVFEIRNLYQSQPTNFEESWALVKASDMIGATNLALKRGIEKEEVIINAHGEQIQWSFCGIRHIEEVSLHDEFSEICSYSPETEARPMIRIHSAAAATFR